MLSEDVFVGFRVDNSKTCEALRESSVSTAWPLAWMRPLPLGSVSLPLVTMGDDCLLGIAVLGVSMLPLAVRATPGLDLPAESGLSGKVVRRFGGVSRGKSGRTIGCDGGRTRGPGELGRDTGAALRPFDRVRPTVVEGPVDGDKDGAEFRRVGVDGLETDLVDGELKFAGIWGLDVGVEGLEFGDGLILSLEELVGDGRTLEGVEDRDGVERAAGVEGLEVDEDRAVGVEGLI